MHWAVVDAFEQLLYDAVLKQCNYYGREQLACHPAPQLRKKMTIISGRSKNKAKATYRAGPHWALLQAGQYILREKEELATNAKFYIVESGTVECRRTFDVSSVVQGGEVNRCLAHASPRTSGRHLYMRVWPQDGRIG